MLRAGNKKWSFEADASTFASLITLRKLIKKNKIKHIISFHSSIKRAKEFRELNNQINNLGSEFGTLHSFHISG